MPLFRLNGAGRPLKRRESQKTYCRFLFGGPDGKWNLYQPLDKADTGFFILGVQHTYLEKEDIMKKEKIIAYRRRCRKIGTGLSHYILLSPKEEKKE